VALPPFQEFYETNRVGVYRYLVGAIGANEAEDCLQEVFIDALRAYPRVRRDSNLRAWVMRIAQRQVIDESRRRKRRPEPTDSITEQSEPLGQEPADGPFGSGLWERVRRLPPMQRGAIVHRFANDCSYAEIARTLGCTEVAARRNVHEGLKKLRAAAQAIGRGA